MMTNRTPPKSPVNNFSKPSELRRREIELWHNYQDAIDALHAEFVRKNQRSGYIYLADCSITRNHPLSPIKIGRSRNPQQRQIELNKFPVIMPMHIHIYRSMWAEDAGRVEAILHRELDDYRGDGEWFSVPDEVEEALSRIWYAEDVRGEILFRDRYEGGRRTFNQHRIHAEAERDKAFVAAMAQDAARLAR